MKFGRKQMTGQIFLIPLLSIIRVQLLVIVQHWENVGDWKKMWQPKKMYKKLKIWRWENLWWMKRWWLKMLMSYFLRRFTKDKKGLVLTVVLLFIIFWSTSKKIKCQIFHKYHIQFYNLNSIIIIHRCLFTCKKKNKRWKHSKKN